MDHFELVEKLREKSGVSYEDAKAALEAANWDLLDAIVILETEGKIESGAKDYSTRQEQKRDASAKSAEEFKSAMSGICQQFKKIVAKGNSIMLNVKKGEDVMFSVPLTVFVILILCAFYVVLPMMIAGLFMGFSYKMSGAGAGDAVVNNAMNKASEIADNIKIEIVNSTKEKGE